MKKILSREFNLGTACVELVMKDRALLTIDCTAVENEVTNSMYQRSELDWLLYNDLLAYVELILNGDPVKYMKTVADNRQSKIHFFVIFKYYNNNRIKSY